MIIVVELDLSINSNSTLINRCKSYNYTARNPFPIYNIHYPDNHYQNTDLFKKRIEELIFKGKIIVKTGNAFVRMNWLFHLINNSGTNGISLPRAVY